MITEKTKVAFVVASVASINAFLAPHIRSLCKNYDVFINVKVDEQNLCDDFPPNVRVEHFPIERKISIIKDLFALILLFKKFKCEQPKLVFSQTPKAGLLAVVAGWAAGVPYRVHCFTGQVWATRKGLARFILKAADICVARLSTHALADSESQVRFLIEQGVIKPDRVRVLASGSISGVDTDRFTPNSKVRSIMRRKFGIPDSDIVFLFLGRLNREKGIPELARAFSRLSERIQDVSLVMAGADEEQISDLVKSITCLSTGKVHLSGHTSEPQNLMIMADVFCLPSHREGFGTVIIEAASCGIPAIGTNIYGISDAIVDGETGVLVPVNCDVSLEQAMLRMVEDTEWRTRLGLNGRERAVSKFSRDIVVKAMHGFLVELIERDVNCVAPPSLQ